MNNNYFADRNLRCLKKTREILSTLPYFCNEFFRGIENQTSHLTRLVYAQDLKIFFNFLVTEIKEFLDMEIKDITLDDLSNPYDVLFHDSDSISLMEMLTKELNSGNDFWESIQKVSFYFKVSEDQILSLIDNLMKEYHISKDLSLQKKLSF